MRRAKAMASRAFESVAGGALAAPVLAETAHGLFSGFDEEHCRAYVFRSGPLRPTKGPACAPPQALAAAPPWPANVLSFICSATGPPSSPSIHVDYLVN